MRDTSKIMKETAMEYKYMRMATYTVDSSKTTKNTEKGNSSGSTWLKNRKNKSNTTTENGGADYQMETALIKNIMVLFYVTLGDSFCGTFKNGLKHGYGQ